MVALTVRTDPRVEVHLSYRSNWLRAAVLGANDGILSVSCLVLGVTGTPEAQVRDDPR
ncbi:MAG: Nodulin 21-related protein [Solirubrobacterales bacterium]|nr:Nodulin 21-related protein [Solirubrobacterales bacterium]